jgi:hypothetical protein
MMNVTSDLGFVTDGLPVVRLAAPRWPPSTIGWSRLTMSCEFDSPSR